MVIIVGMKLLSRNNYLKKLAKSISRAFVTALLGPRQCGKTTLARMLTESYREPVDFYDLESHLDQKRLQNPELVLGASKGLVVLDEVQTMPSLFPVLRVLSDRKDFRARFLILGSASPHLVKDASETLAGRVEFVELAGFDLRETGADSSDPLWLRGGFPRSFLARSEGDSLAWREGFIKTFLERDLPQLGISLPAPAMRRFWTMLAHYHGQLWNASELARSMGLSDKTVRSWLDILTGAYMIRQLQPWFENIKKRQVKSPKIYLTDSGLLHSLLSIQNKRTLLAHPKVGASWEGFALEQFLRIHRPPEAYFWATHSGAELDLFLLHAGKRYGVEAKFSEAPEVTRSMRIALNDLALDHLFVLYPGTQSFPMDDRITAIPVAQIVKLNI